VDRRAFYKLLTLGIGAVAGAFTAIPGLISVIAPAVRRRGPTWRPLGRVGEFEMDEIRRAAVAIPREDWSEAPEVKAVYVWRLPAPDEFVVFSRNCTDLSCPVVWDPGSERFFCPCHGGIFAKDGEPVAGPPRRPLWRYAHRVRNGLLEIDLASVPPVA
jgi:menaquinol-cytochrome c reductase iron-sulfur subunit